ncbi:GNAT family N-acetyltransferase [Thomasclavelia sp.]
MQKLLLKDYDKIKTFLDDADYEGYNSNFVTMMMWDHEYEIFYEIKENFLIMLHTYMNEKFFAMPFCKPEYYQDALEYMLEYANKHNFTFRIDLAVEKSKALIEELYGDKFLYLHDEDFDDYIYSKSSLETLSGKKMQKRRNHFNAFLKEHPDYIYKEIEDEDIDNVLQCLKKWDFSRRIEESVVSEYIGIVYLLVHRHELNIKTGCIYIDNKLEAFIIGSPLKHNTVQIHVEKANKDIRGLYVAIGKFFLEQNYENYEFVNREEDMGLESLRKAKLALHPIKLLKKYTIILNNQTISQASDNDLYNIIDLWRNSFNDENEKSTNFYFMNRYQKENTYVLKNSDLVVSMLQIVPYTLIFEGKEENVYFILGVATNKTYRKQGLMKKLMNYVLSLPKYQNAKIILQAYHPELYYKFGFFEDYYHKVTEVDKDLYRNNFLLKTTENSDYIKLLNLYDRFCNFYTGYRKRDIEYYQNYLIPRCAAFDEKIERFDLNNKPIGYAIYSEDDTAIKISEIIYLEQSYLDMIISYFITFDKKIIIESDLKAIIKGECTYICTMMSNFLKNNCQDNKFYINECL